MLNITISFSKKKHMIGSIILNIFNLSSKNQIKKKLWKNPILFYFFYKAFRLLIKTQME